MSNVPLFINNNLNSNYESFAMQKSSPLYDENDFIMDVKSKKKEFLYQTSDVVNDEPPPEYSETDESEYSENEN